MRFDDRLATVLHQPVGDAHDRAVRWRQLVDLVARAGSFEQSPIVAEALTLIAADSGSVADDLRAAAARSVAAPSLPFELVRYFTSESIAVAAPVLGAVQLSDEQWRQLLPDASPEARGFIAALRPWLETAAFVPRRDDAAAPAPVPPAAPAGDTAAAAKPRRQRLEGAAPDLTAGPIEQPALFRWECDSLGMIGWVEGAPRGALIGRSIARSAGGDGVDREVERAFAGRAPFREQPLELAGEGIAAGRWRISGIPAFSGGRFLGYRGLAIRERARADRPLPQAAASADHQSLRELVHELRTPLNAIIGFAEIIEAQLLGEADERYRHRAAEIVAQARLLLAAIGDLDLAAKLQAESGRGGRTADLAALLEAMVDELADLARARGAWIEVEPPSGPLPANIDPLLAERLVRRFFGSVIDRAAAGERLNARAERSGGHCRLALSRPRAMGDGGRAAGELDLRLVRGLARVSGGDVSIEQESIMLALPAA